MNALVIGGAGFIGANVARRHLVKGDRVTVFDNLSRRGSRENLMWLESESGGRLRVVPGDAARDRSKLDVEVRRADAVYHLAGQVAVTTSLLDPLGDHESNLTATLLVLEAMRLCGSSAPFLFASTNKVYGALPDVPTELVEGRWTYEGGLAGIDERRPLDFHSPYGCSKGAADQYVRDYARMYGLNTIVFRQSCIYGPRQFGVEDQGWLVHFILAFAFGVGVTIFGDGRQVRDALFIDDLIAAYEAALPRAAELRGEVFNVGGGSANRLSILELVSILETLFAHGVPITYAPWRLGDQRVFVADNAKLERALGWSPRTDIGDGLRRTVAFVREHLPLFERAVRKGGGTLPLAPQASKITA